MVMNMGAKNDYLTRLQAKVATNELLAKAETNAHTKQAMCDSIMLTLGYGECMKGDPWGEQRIMAFMKEVLETYEMIVHPGLEARNDADGFRDKVDKMLEKKCPKAFESWPDRYVFWTEETLEQEAARERRIQNRKKKR